MSALYRHLNLAERSMIEARRSLGERPATIARALGRSRSTITREIDRNGSRHLRASDPRRVVGKYDAALADRHAGRVARRPRVARKLRPGMPLWPMVLERLELGLSPQQIAGTLTRMLEPARISHETIYTSLYAVPRGPLRDHALSQLRRKHKARRSRRAPNDRRNRVIPDMVLIDQRPEEVGLRVVPGHWEGDLIIGKSNRSQVGTLVERSTLFVALVKLDSSKADVVAEGFATILDRFDSQMRRSLTYDQGTEMRHHQKLTERTGVQVYFANPHAPWERGICENINGLLRQYLPKGTDLSIFTQDQLDEIAWKLNTRPRASMKWKAPAELFLPEGAFDFKKFYAWNPDKITNVALGP
jgi:IS30 family transposase